VSAGKRHLRCGRLSIGWRPRAVLLALGLVAIGLALAVLLMGTGTIALSPAEVLASLTGTGDDPMAARVVQRIRLPRVATAALVGASLGMAGAVFQSLSRNALGSPDVIGFTTGAATGAIAQIILFNAGAAQTATAAVASGLMTAAIVMLLARKDGSTGGYRLILIGIGVGAILTGLNTLLMVKGDLDQAISAQIWLAGSLSARSWAHALPVLVGLILFAPLVILNARRLAMLEMGDDLASQLGIRPERTRLLLVLAAVGLTAVATAATGPIAFVALAAPQLARRLSRAPEIPIVTGALAGAVLLLAADLLSQRAPMNLMLPIGLTTSALGGAYLVWMLTRAPGTGGR
jgi:iron complex transport system permease protein